MTNGNDAAFSRAGLYADADTFDAGAEGMTKREYFAARALGGLLSDELTIYTPKETTHHQVVARNAVAYADALMAALNEELNK